MEVWFSGAFLMVIMSISGISMIVDEKSRIIPIFIIFFSTFTALFVKAVSVLFGFNI